MLKYTIKPNIERKLTEFSYRGFYVSPELDLISGVTDYDTGLVNGESVLIKSPYLIGSETNIMNVENVDVQGKLAIKVELPVKSVTKTLKFDLFSNFADDPEITDSTASGWSINTFNGSYEILDDVSGTTFYTYKTIVQKYVEYKGDISYFFNSDDENKSGYVVGHKFYKAPMSASTIVIDDYAYIENDSITFDDDIVYKADFSVINNSGEPIQPDLRISQYLSPMKGGEYIGKIYGKSCSASTNADAVNLPAITKWHKNDWKKIQKFSIIKKVDPVLKVKTTNMQGRVDSIDTDNNIFYGYYEHYITYSGNNYIVEDIYGNNENHEYLGYGCMINGIFAECNIKYNAEKQDKLIGTYVELPMGEGYEYVKNALRINRTSGKIVVIMLADEKTDVRLGNIIEASSNKPIDFDIDVETDYISNVYKDATVNIENGYIMFLGKKYDIKKKLADKITIAGSEYRLNYTNGFLYSSAYVNVNGEIIEFDIKYFTDETEETEVDYDEYKESESPEKHIKATYDKNIYYNANNGTPLVVRYGIIENAYNIIECDGVDINGTIYEVKEKPSLSYNEETEDYDEVINRYVTIQEKVKIQLEVIEINGSSTLVCDPIVNSDEFDYEAAQGIKNEMSHIIVNNRNSFTFRIKRNTFGEIEFLAENGIMNAMTAQSPYSISDSYLLDNKIKIYRIGGILSMDFPLTNGIGINLLKEDLVKNSFVKEVEDNSINRIVDMEKDIYYPAYLDGNELMPISELRFNMHFRTRNLDNWKVIEDDREFNKCPFKDTGGSDIFTTDTAYTYNSRYCNWFVTDYEYYKNETIKKYLHNSSDLLGYMNFTNGDVYNQAKKISKSFLRLSFYSTNNPQTQVLLGTSTIFLDEHAALAKYLYLKRNSDLKYVNTQTMQKAGYSTVEEYLENIDTAVYQVTSNTVSVESEVATDTGYIPDNLRLSSRLTVYDKYLSDASSEGFYIYMFKEYSTKMREGIIYMRVDFNHAGIGKSIPMIIPRKGIDDGVGIPLYLHKDEDTLKKGFNMEEMYKQLYLPIYVKYDDVSGKHFYYLDKNLRENEELGVDKEIMEFNLFEVKFANESIVEL